MRGFPFFLFALLALAGCKAVDAMDNTDSIKQNTEEMKSTTNGLSDKTQEMNDTTKGLSRDSKAGIGLAAFDDESNNQEYSPPSAPLLGGAKLMAENMSADDLTDFVFIRLYEINKTGPREEAFHSEILGGYTFDYVVAFNRLKRGKLAGLQALAGQIPQSVVEEIVKKQIFDGGNRSDTALNLLMLRSTFLNDYLLDRDVFNFKINNMSKLEKAFQDIQNLEFIADQPFADQIKYDLDDSVLLPNPHDVLPPKFPAGHKGCKTKHEVKSNPDCGPTLAPAPNLSLKLDPGLVKPWWIKLAIKIQRDIPPALKAPDSPFAARIEEIRQVALEHSK